MSTAANPRAPKDDTVITEGTGTITSDSLAAESLNSGGSFADGNAVPDSVPSKSTTTNTTDTSSATTLPPARDASSRDNAGATDDVGSGGSSGGNSSVGGSSGGSSSVGDSSGGGSSSTYAGAVSSGQSSDENERPKGQNVTEGGFDSNAPNASFNNDIGGKNDPGRVAETKFAQSAARSGGGAGYEGSNDTEVSGSKQGFESLGETSA